MKKLSFLFVFIVIITPASAQLTKGNWLVGGSGDFTIFKVLKEKTHYVQASANIGHFFFDKFAIGVKPSYTYSFAKSEGSSSFAKSHGFYFGPFARYYFLPVEHPFNILVEGTYQHGIERKGSEYATTNYSLNSFSFAGGPVIYFNSAVGLEFLVRYGQTKYTKENYHESRLQFGIGLQVHLEKN